MATDRTEEPTAGAEGSRLRRDGVREGDEPASGSPTDLGGGGWLAALKRSFKEFSDDNITHWAAALTYYAVLSIFPAIIALVSILGLFGESAIQPLIDNVTTLAPGPAEEIVVGALEGLQSSQGAAGVLFFVGLAGAIWSASGYVSGFMDASNDIWDVEEGRPIYKKLPVRFGTTLLLLLLLTVSALAVVISGPVAEQVGNLVGLGDAAVTAYQIAKWPILLLLVSFMLAVLYYAAPNVKQPGFRWVTPGGVFAVVLWLVASALFALYLANFSSYNETYGTLGGVISFLVWLWITNIAVLMGAELNSELERGRQVQAGKVGLDDEPFLPPRDEPKAR